MSAIGYITGAFAIATLLIAVALRVRKHRTRSEHDTARGYPHGGEMADLNRLLQEGTISSEEYELLKRRILAGQVY
ncbi:SHOCT domain-containing protein [Noviherbaspirillum aerium]|uniref:SHOCT domain-containing protein n=1 Tax=Noviherbaspirillum aerium TaxID=2588497 RepID=UPI00124F30C2|nr:SHOCT domain-containing protein [Noviherbaspirillum aerium]